MNINSEGEVLSPKLLGNKFLHGLLPIAVEVNLNRLLTLIKKCTILHRNVR